MSDGYVTVTEILEERILQPTVDDVTMSAAIEDDTGQKAEETHTERQLSKFPATIEM